MITITYPRSRPAEEPKAHIDAESERMAMLAEIRLLRGLVERCDSYLAVVVQEARIAGVPDAQAEGLRRDIRVVLSG